MCSFSSHYLLCYVETMLAKLENIKLCDKGPNSQMVGLILTQGTIPLSFIDFLITQIFVFVLNSLENFGMLNLSVEILCQLEDKAT